MSEQELDRATRLAMDILRKHATMGSVADYLTQFTKQKEGKCYPELSTY